MNLNLKRGILLVLILILLCSIPILAQSKKRKKVPRPKNRREVVTMGASIGHDVEWKRDPKTGQVIAVSSENPDENYTSPEESINSSKGTKSSRKQPGTLSSKGQVTFDEFEHEIVYRMLNEDCCAISDWNKAHSVFQEMKNQLAAGRKVVLDDGYVVRPSDLFLDMTFAVKAELITTYSNGATFRETYERDDEQVLIGSSSAHWAACSILKRHSLTMFTGHCESTDLTVPEITDVNLEIANGKLQGKLVTRTRMDTRETRYTGTFRYASVTVEPGRER